MTRTERMQKIDPFIDRLNAIHGDIRRVLSDLDAGKLAGVMPEDDAETMFGFFGLAAKKLDTGMDLLKHHALRKDD